MLIKYKIIFLINIAILNDFLINIIILNSFLIIKTKYLLININKFFTFL